MVTNGRYYSDSLNGLMVAVVGFGRQGQALARWLPKRGAFVVVYDKRTESELGIKTSDFPEVRFLLGENAKLLEMVSLVCVSGGVPLDNPIIVEAQQKGIPITNDAQLFIERSPAPVIGITGSAGKTTTTTLTGEILKRAGYTTWTGGNIGNVLLDDLAEIQPDDLVVMELSSFQLDLMTVSPRIGAVLNITPNHLDRHGTMEAYTRAKANIILHQKQDDFAVLNFDDAGSRMLEGAASGFCVWFSADTLVADGAFMAGQRLLVVGMSSPDGDPHVVCERDEIPLRGDHNVRNVLAACAITGIIGVSPDIMREAIIDFKPVPHRLEVVRELNGVTYVNDSIATAPERVVAALRSYSEPLVLLAGGKDKKLPWDEMILLALRKSRHIIAFGDAGELVVNKVRELSGNEDAVTRVQTLEEAVKLAATIAQAGDIVLLSPGGTSYDAYNDFAERGEHFRQLVSQL